MSGWFGLSPTLVAHRVQKSSTWWCEGVGGCVSLGADCPTNRYAVSDNPMPEEGVDPLSPIGDRSANDHLSSVHVSYLLFTANRHNTHDSDA